MTTDRRFCVPVFAPSATTCSWCGETVDGGNRCVRHAVRKDNGLGGFSLHPECDNAYKGHNGSISWGYMTRPSTIPDGIAGLKDPCDEADDYDQP